MNALASRGGGFGNRRLHPRIDVGQPMILISVSSRIDGEMRDLSRYGARVRLRNPAPQRGRDVLLRWGSHEIFGHVVWSEGADAGIAFHKPIAEDELADTLGGVLPVAMPAGRKVI